MIACAKLKDEQADSEIIADLLRIEALVNLGDPCRPLFKK